MDRQTLFTIGHSNRTIEEFIALLRDSEVTALADVRSSPFSGRNPQFNRESLKESLKASGIEYVFLGEELGARRSELDCYEGGIAQYDLIAKAPRFISGLERVRRGAESYRIALMCSERDPLTCHRMILVCRHMGLDDIYHIVGQGEVEHHADAEHRLLRLLGLYPNDMFQDVDSQLARAYHIQAKKIAYSLPKDSDGWAD